MDIIRRRNISPETRRLVEQRNNLFRPGSLRRRYDNQTQRTIVPPSRPSKRSREQIAEIDAELIRGANRIGGGYQPIKVEEEQEEPEEIREEEEIEQAAETEEDSVIMRGDNLPIGFTKTQHRRKRGEIYSNKPYRRKTNHEQKINRSSHQEGRI